MHTFTNTHKQTKRKPSLRQTLLSACDNTRPLFETNKGNPLSPALSIVRRLTIPRHVPDGKTSPTLPSQSSKILKSNQHPCRLTCTSPLAPDGLPWRRDYTQAGSLRRGLWQFTFVRTLQIWPSLDQAASFSSFLHKQPHPCCWRRAASPSVITSLMPWCNEENIHESDGGCGLKNVNILHIHFLDR